MLNEKFVCFAPGWFINSDDAVYKAAWERFYHAKPLPGEGDGWLKGSQLVLMTSAGRLLSGAMKYGDRSSLAAALEQVLESYARLPEEQRRPESVEGTAKPVPEPPPGGLVLTIYDRPLARDGKGGFRIPRDGDINPHASRLAAPAGQRSSLWLTRRECESLVPDEPHAGQILTVPDKLARRIFLYGLWPNSLWVVENAWKPDSLKSGELKLTVSGVSEGAVTLRIYGKAHLEGQSVHKGVESLPIRYDARVEGVVTIDRAKRAITRWDMAALGDYTGEWFAEDGGRWRAAKEDAPLALGFAFEIDPTAYQLPPERRRPRSFVHAYIFRDREEYYWDPLKWAENRRRD
ncbi:MAG TPA: hypothetical protein VG796_05575 [Verrucomicrobiales bacterium]|nr:hypothetical protein [Verrucomicrobiales bacterium]